ncbi:MAG: POTRA domain-containing protein, partial [Bacteroidota bacterium]
TIDKVTVSGNDRTHQHVILRELRTLPGKKFSRSEIIRSQREIINLGYFNPEALDIQTPVNPQRGTVDIEYKVEEKPSDQLELSAGWGGRGRGVIGTLGVSFNNFSVRNIFNKSSWRPLPQGDGQRLSLRAQTNGRFFQSYNASFTEPWLGGKKPTSFTLGGFHTRLTNGRSRSSSGFQSLAITNISVGLGTRLKFPDDFFVSNTTLSFQNIALNDWTFRRDFVLEDGTFLTNGSFNSISLNQTIARSSISDPLFPTSGSKFSLAIQVTPPHSLFNNKDFRDIDPQEKFRWVEYHKWRFNAEWYTQVFGKFVVKAAAKIGMLGFYNEDIGSSPFERFVLGGDGLANQQTGLLGYDLISLRGYEIESLPNSQDGGATVFDKFTVELRYPISLNPSSTIYVLLFAEGGNSWRSFRDFNPFDLRRSVGGGLRVFL